MCYGCIRATILLLDPNTRTASILVVEIVRIEEKKTENLSPIYKTFTDFCCASPTHTHTFTHKIFTNNCCSQPTDALLHL